jgi:hypothetical protein
MKPIIAYYLLAVVLDYLTTIVQAPEMEENPFMRYWWLGAGNFGFTAITVLLAVLVVRLYTHLFDHYSRYATFGAWVLGILSTFKILIALTNANLIPYWVTGWYQF